MPLFRSPLVAKLWLKSMCLRCLPQTSENDNKHNLSRLYNDLFQICKKSLKKISVNLNVRKYRLDAGIATAWRAGSVLLVNPVFVSLCAMLNRNHTSIGYRPITLETLRIENLLRVTESLVMSLALLSPGRAIQEYGRREAGGR